MGKIGRNDPCPCGSGKKFKKCCLQQSAAGDAGQRQIQPAQPSLKKEIEKIQLDAEAHKSIVRKVGVFILFSTDSGNGWLLEVTGMDAVQVAENGKKLALELEENPETIEINWSHKFEIKNKKLFLTSYADKSKTTLEDSPTHAIAATIKKILKNIPPEVLESLHVDEELVESGS